MLSIEQPLPAQGRGKRKMPVAEAAIILYDTLNCDTAIVYYHIECRAIVAHIYREREQEKKKT